MDVQRLKKKVSSLFATTGVQRAASSVLFASVLCGTSLSAAFAAPAQKLELKPHPLAVTPAGARHFREDQIIIVPKEGLEKEEFNDSLKAIEGEVIAKDPILQAYLVKVPKGQLEKDYSKALKDKNFQIVQKNMIWRPQVTSFTKTPNDPGFRAGLQGCLTQLNIPNAWALGASGQGVVVGSLDTGVDFEHNLDLSGRTTGFGGGFGYNSALNYFGGQEEDLSFGHGSFTMTCFGATTNNGFGFASGAFNSQIVPCCIVTGKDLSSDDFLIARGIDFLRANGVKLANLSFGTDPPESNFDFKAHPLFQLLETKFGAEGGMIFTAVGNSGLSDLGANTVLGVVPVAAVDSANMPANFTNFGPEVMFAAPGVDIANTAAGGKAFIASGTSFSSPYAASVAAMVKSVRPDLPYSTIVQIMQKTATPPPTSFPQSNFFYGSGIPNAAAAVRMAQTSF